MGSSPGNLLNKLHSSRIKGSYLTNAEEAMLGQQIHQGSSATYKALDY